MAPKPSSAATQSFKARLKPKKKTRETMGFPPATLDWPNLFQDQVRQPRAMPESLAYRDIASYMRHYDTIFTVLDLAEFEDPYKLTEVRQQIRDIVANHGVTYPWSHVKVNRAHMAAELISSQDGRWRFLERFIGSWAACHLIRVVYQRRYFKAQRTARGLPISSQNSGESNSSSQEGRGTSSRDLPTNAGGLAKSKMKSTPRGPGLQHEKWCPPCGRYYPLIDWDRTTDQGCKRHEHTQDGALVVPRQALPATVRSGPASTQSSNINVVPRGFSNSQPVYSAKRTPFQRFQSSEPIDVPEDIDNCSPRDLVKRIAELTRLANEDEKRSQLAKSKAARLQAFIEQRRKELADQPIDIGSSSSGEEDSDESVSEAPNEMEGALDGALQPSQVVPPRTIASAQGQVGEDDDENDEDENDEDENDEDEDDEDEEDDSGKSSLFNNPAPTPTSLPKRLRKKATFFDERVPTNKSKEPRPLAKEKAAGKASQVLRLSKSRPSKSPKVRPPAKVKQLNNSRKRRGPVIQEEPARRSTRQSTAREEEPTGRGSGSLSLRSAEQI